MSVQWCGVVWCGVWCVVCGVWCVVCGVGNPGQAGRAGPPLTKWPPSAPASLGQQAELSWAESGGRGGEWFDWSDGPDLTPGLSQIRVRAGVLTESCWLSLGVWQSLAGRGAGGGGRMGGGGGRVAVYFGVLSPRLGALKGYRPHSR